MPEEVNRLVTDQLADLLFSHCEDANINLQREGVSTGKVHNVGNVMIDSLIRFLPLTEHYKVNGLPEDFALVTLHRPSNVDDARIFRGILKSLLEINERLRVVFLFTRARAKPSRLLIWMLRRFISWSRCPILNSWLLSDKPWWLSLIPVEFRKRPLT